MTVYFIKHITIKPMLKKKLQIHVLLFKKMHLHEKLSKYFFIFNTISLQTYERICAINI